MASPHVKGAFRMLWCLFMALTILSTADGIELKAKTHDVDLEVDEETNWTVSLSKVVNETILINIARDSATEVEILPRSVNVTENTTDLTFRFFIKPLKAGHFIVSLNASSEDIDVTQAFVRVAANHISALDIVSAVIGWIYTITWVVSYFPQIYINWKRKSVIGLSFDYLGLNLTGFLGYSIFNISLKYLHGIQQEYFVLHPKGLIPVEINDVIFSLGGVIVTVILIIQCFIYERGEQSMSRFGMVSVAGLWIAAVIYLILILAGVVCGKPWLPYVNFLSYIKMAITFVKYVPQAYLNFTRKSTIGWSIGNVLLDLTGGVFSILQMFILAYNYDDWSSIFGNFAKFGVAMFSIFFDTIFIVQHYCLYTKREDELKLIQ